MNGELPPAGPRRILQLFSREKAEESRHLSAKAKLAWLEGIKLLYWKALTHRRPSPR